MLGYISSVTTGTLVACIVWYGIARLEDGESLLEASLPYVTLPEILLLGILCGVETELLLPCREMSLKQEGIWHAGHFLLVTATALGCGYFYDWYEQTFSGVMLMCLTSAIIYLFTCFVNYWRRKKETNEMNKHLEEYRKGKD